MDGMLFFSSVGVVPTLVLSAALPTETRVSDTPPQSVLRILEKLFSETPQCYTSVLSLDAGLPWQRYTVSLTVKRMFAANEDRHKHFRLNH